MSGHVIPLRGDAHARVQFLLPWFVTGRLEADDLAQVTAHLDQCPECRAEVVIERRLIDEVQAMPVEVEPGWALMRARLDSRRPRAGWLASLGARLRGPAWVGWAIAGQAVVVAAGVVLVLAWRPAAPPAIYRTLGSAPAAASGNMLVMFRPDAREADLRAAILASHARLVDGPTAADAYVLSVPVQERARALTTLRGAASVVMAEPIDPAGPS